MITGRNDLSGAVSDSTVLDDPLDQPVTITAASRTCGDTLGAQVVVPILTNAAVIMAIRDGAATFIAINAEHAVGRVVRDDRELMLFGLHLEVAEARLTDGLLCLVTSLYRVDSRENRNSWRGSRAQDGLEVTVTRLIELQRGL